MTRLLLLLLFVGSSACERADAQAPAAKTAPTSAGPATVRGESRAAHTEERQPERVFSKGRHIDDMPEMRAGDWLHRHHEPGQTFEQFEASRWRQKVVDSRKTIYLQPIGAFESKHAPELEELKAFTATFFQLPVKVNPPLALDDEKYRGRASRGFGRQYRTDDILEHLKTNLPEDAYCMLGITMADVYPGPDWNFVFGQASLHERVGVFSFARHVPAGAEARKELNEDQARLMRLRNYKVLSHEIGHMFGIEHCTAFHCGMNGSNSMDETDRSPLHWCHVCQRKLHHAVGFDPVKRYSALEANLVADLPEQAGWYESRRKWVGEAPPTR